MWPTPSAGRSGRPRRPPHRAPGFRHATAPGRPILTPPRMRFPQRAKAIVKIYPTSFSQLVVGDRRDSPLPYLAVSSRRRQPIPTSWPSPTSGGSARAACRSMPRPGVHPPGLPAARQLRDEGRRVRLVRLSPEPHVDGAYGLVEFQDMAKVHDVDPNLIVRTASGCSTSRGPTARGSRKGIRFIGPAESSRRRAQARLSTTAYIAMFRLCSG